MVRHSPFKGPCDPCLASDRAKALPSDRRRPWFRYRDDWTIAPEPGRPEHVAMKRIAAAPLWFLAGWFAGSAVAWTLGLGPFVAPIAAVALAAFTIADPMRLFWDRGGDARATAITRLAASTDSHTS
jgi:hypothetical protein